MVGRGAEGRAGQGFDDGTARLSAVNSLPTIIPSVTRNVDTWMSGRRWWCETLAGLAEPSATGDDGIRVPASTVVTESEASASLPMLGRAG